jgi:hypothetical protein
MNTERYLESPTCSLPDSDFEVRHSDCGPTGGIESIIRNAVEHFEHELSTGLASTVANEIEAALRAAFGGTHQRPPPPPPPAGPRCGATQADQASWHQACAAHESATAFNADLDGKIAQQNQEMSYLRTLLSRRDFDMVLTDGELGELAVRGSAEEREAATWLLAHPEVKSKLAKLGTMVGGPGIDLNANASILADYQREIEQLNAQRREVPSLPPAPTGGRETAPTDTSDPVAPRASRRPPTELALSDDPRGDVSTDSADDPSVGLSSGNSKQPGLEGAAENVQDALTMMANEIKRLTNELKQPGLTAEERETKTRAIEEMAQSHQLLTSLFSQLRQMISQMVKMYADAAQVAIQNSR